MMIILPKNCDVKLNPGGVNEPAEYVKWIDELLKVQDLLTFVHLIKKNINSTKILYLINK